MPRSSANQRLRQERLKRGWSEQALADRIQQWEYQHGDGHDLPVDRNYVHRWETGKRGVSAFYAVRLEGVFGLSRAQLGLVDRRSLPPVDDALVEELSMADAPPPTGPAAEAARAFRLALEHNRAERGWSYRQVASRAKYSEAHISTVVEGRQRPTRKMAAALDMAFGTGTRYYELWERFDQARHDSEPPAQRPNPSPPEMAAPRRPNVGAEAHTNRRDAIKTLGVLLLAGAARTRHLLQDAESSNVGPLTLAEYDDTVWWLTRNAGVQPYPTLLATADQTAAEVAELLKGRQSAKHHARLELLTGQLAWFQALFAFELGEYGIARTHLRLARHYGEQLHSTTENDATATVLLASIADTETNLALYGGHFDMALTIVRTARRYATEHTAARLAALEARALAGASPGLHRELTALVDQAEAAIPSRPTFEPGAVPPIGPERFQRFAATALVQARHEQAEQYARAAVQGYEALQKSRGEDFHYTNLAIARLDLAAARLQAKRPDPEEAAQLGMRALSMPSELRSDPVRRRTVELLTMFGNEPSWRDLAAVKELADAARSYRPLALPAPSSDPR